MWWTQRRRTSITASDDGDNARSRSCSTQGATRLKYGVRISRYVKDAQESVSERVLKFHLKLHNVASDCTSIVSGCLAPMNGCWCFFRSCHKTQAAPEQPIPTRTRSGIPL